MHQRDKLFNSSVMYRALEPLSFYLWTNRLYLLAFVAGVVIGQFKPALSIVLIVMVPIFVHELGKLLGWYKVRS